MTFLAGAIRKTLRAPAILFSVYVLTLLVALPPAMLVRSSIESQLRNSMTADQVAQSFSPSWLLEYRSRAGELGKSLDTTVIGFAAVLDNLSTLIDREARPPTIIWIGVAYILLWLFLSGGIIDRFARNRPTHSFEFFTACGVYFFRLLRLAPVMVVAYYVVFGLVHPLLFDDLFGAMTLDVTAERTAFAYRVLLYFLFLLILITTNVIFDYAKVRLVVEDRRSVIGAVAASVRFVRRHAAAVASVYLINSLVFLSLLIVYAVVAPGVGGTAVRILFGFALGQLYLLGRVWVKLIFLASETALFQSRLAQPGYVASPPAALAEPPIVEQVVG